MADTAENRVEYEDKEGNLMQTEIEEQKTGAAGISKQASERKGLQP